MFAAMVSRRGDNMIQLMILTVFCVGIVWMMT